MYLSTVVKVVTAFTKNCDPVIVLHLFIAVKVSAETRVSLDTDLALGLLSLSCHL